MGECCSKRDRHFEPFSAVPAECPGKSGSTPRRYAAAPIAFWAVALFIRSRVTLHSHSLPASAPVGFSLEDATPRNRDRRARAPAVAL